MITDHLIHPLTVRVCVCVTVACGVWQDGAEHSEEPSDLLRPAGPEHLLCRSGGTHLFPDPFNAGGGCSEQVRSLAPAAPAVWRSLHHDSLTFAKLCNKSQLSLWPCCHCHCGKWITTPFCLSVQQEWGVLLPYHQHGVWESLCRRAFYQWEGNLHVSAR